MNWSYVRASYLEEAELVEELEVGGDLVEGDQVPAEQNEGDKRGRHHRLSVLERVSCGADGNADGGPYPDEHRQGPCGGR